MSNRAPIQVPEELKGRIEGLKQKLYAGTLPATIEKLADYYERNEREKARDKQIQAERMIDVGSEVKQDFVNFRSEMSFTSDAQAILFLLAHYNDSASVSKKTLKLYRDLLK